MGNRNIFNMTLISVSILLFFSGSTLASVAPLNPCFIKAIEKNQELDSRSTERENITREWMPSPVDLSHLAGVTIFADQKTGNKSFFPDSFDLRAEGCVTPVRNQLPYGTCWAFSTIASLESSFLKSDGTTSPDYSEQFLVYYAFIDQSDTILGFGNHKKSDFPTGILNLNGSDFMATATLARWTGVVDESEAPYGETAPSASAPVSRHFQNAYYLYYNPETGYRNISVENVKQALISYGAVSVSIFTKGPEGDKTSPYFNNKTYASYVPKANPDGLTAENCNHAVAVVGWNDNYPRGNFNPLNQPSSDGAWIIRNSFGKEWADSGYFYISYEDAVMASGVAYVAENADNYSSIYQYDIFGWCESYAPEGMTENTAWFSNVFTANGSENLEAVSFYTGGTDNTYEIKVYLDVKGTPTSGTLAFSQKEVISAPGYHTIKLKKPQTLLKNQKFAVVVKLKTPGYSYPVAIETPIKGHSDKATASEGQSFLSHNGVDWIDATKKEKNTNVCLKAFTSKTQSNSGCSTGFTPAFIFLTIPLVLFLKR